MKAYYLNKNNNKNLIVFFAGWSFDRVPFQNSDFGENDVIIVYDYNDLSQLPEEFNDFKNYGNKTLLAWSMGVFVAYLNKDLFENFSKRIAINGTVYPVNDKFGIPEKIFKLTLIHSKKGLEGKFYANLFDNKEEFERYLQNPVSRSIDNRVSELENLYNFIKNTSINYEKFYDSAIVSTKDKIIPPQNQINCHKNFNIPVTEIDCGHFPFYRKDFWKEF